MCSATPIGFIDPSNYPSIRPISKVWVETIWSYHQLWISLSGLWLAKSLHGLAWCVHIFRFVSLRICERLGCCCWKIVWWRAALRWQLRTFSIAMQLRSAISQWISINAHFVSHSAHQSNVSDNRKTMLPLSWKTCTNPMDHSVVLIYYLLFDYSTMDRHTHTHTHTQYACYSSDSMHQIDIVSIGNENSANGLWLIFINDPQSFGYMQTG